MTWLETSDLIRLFDLSFVFNHETDRLEKVEDFQNIHFMRTGTGHTPVFWGHGWGHTHKNFMPMTQSLEKTGKHVVIDFPGFGASPAPQEIWGTEDYADAVAALIRANTTESIIWVGHSFGCRVGLQLAARHPDLIAGLFLISAAGLPRKRSLWNRVYFGARIKLFKVLKALIPFGISREWLYSKFGSADYKNAGPLREIFVKVVNEDLSRIAASLRCRVSLVYGSRDTETPPEMGERLSKLIPNSELYVLDGHDHYSILMSGKHKVLQKLNAFIKEVKTNP